MISMPHMCTGGACLLLPIKGHVRLVLWIALMKPHQYRHDIIVMFHKAYCIFNLKNYAHAKNYAHGTRFYMLSRIIILYNQTGVLFDEILAVILPLVKHWKRIDQHTYFWQTHGRSVTMILMPYSVYVHVVGFYCWQLCVVTSHVKYSLWYETTES